MSAREPIYPLSQTDDFPGSPACHWEFENYLWDDLETDGRMHDQAVFRIGFEAGHEKGVDRGKYESAIQREELLQIVEESLAEQDIFMHTRIDRMEDAGGYLVLDYKGTSYTIEVREC